MKNYNIVYSKEAEKFRKKYVMLIIDELPRHYSSQLDRRVLFSAFDRTASWQKRLKLSLEDMVRQIMKRLIQENMKGSFLFTVYVDDEISRFSEDFLSGSVYSDSVIDKIETCITDNLRFQLKNVVGISFEDGVLKVVGKEELKEKTKCYRLENQSLSIHKAGGVVDVEIRQRFRKDIDFIMYKSTDYWFIEADVFRCIINRKYEQHPLIELASSYTCEKKIRLLEMRTWFVDDIITKMPDSCPALYSKTYHKTDLDHTKMIEKFNMMKKEFELITRKDYWKNVESQHFIATYSAKNAFTFKIVAKDTKELVCICYHI